MSKKQIVIRIMAFTEYEKFTNYQKLHRSIVELESGRKPTDDWEQEHFNFFSKIRETFPNINKLNPECEDADFRTTLHECEQLARYLEMHWEGHGILDYGSYLQLLTRMRFIIEYTMEDDEIATLMESIQV